MTSPIPGTISNDNGDIWGRLDPFSDELMSCRFGDFAVSWPNARLAMSHGWDVTGSVGDLATISRWPARCSERTKRSLMNEIRKQRETRSWLERST